MEDVGKWLMQYKRPFILAGVIGLILAPVLWPFYFAILFQTVSLAVPALIVWTVIQKKERKISNEQKRDHECPGTENAEVPVRKDETDRQQSADKKTEKADSVQKRDKDKREESVRNHFERGRELSDASCLAVTWYRLEGREKILRLMRKLEREGKLSFSISPEGICSVRKADGFRRVGTLRAYPGREMKILIKELKKDHIRAVQKGKYLWLSWGKGA